jgi:hypothetical protein
VKVAWAEKIIKPSTKRAMKRKVGYVNEGVSITRTRLARLQIGEGSEVARGNLEGANKEVSSEGPSE